MKIPIHTKKAGDEDDDDDIVRICLLTISDELSILNFNGSGAAVETVRVCEERRGGKRDLYDIHRVH